MTTEAAASTTEQQPPPKNWSLLASEAFGDTYKGEVTQDPPAATEETTEAETETTTEETTTAPSKEVEAAETTETTQETQEVPVSSLSQLAELHEYDPEWINTLKVPVKINGASGEATMEELVRSYQTQQAADQRLTEAKEKAKAESARIAQRYTELDNQFAVVAQLVDAAEKTLKADEAAIDWNKLRTEDPAEWSAKKAEIAARQQHIQSLKSGAITAYQQVQGKVQAESETNLSHYVQQEAQNLMKAMGEAWKDEKVMNAEKQEIGSYLLKSGFSKEEVGQAYDHRMILLARKAMLYDKAQDKTEIVKAKVTKIPKVLKPGAPKSKEAASQEAKANAMGKLRQTGSLDDALAALRAQRG